MQRVSKKGGVYKVDARIAILPGGRREWMADGIGHHECGIPLHELIQKQQAIIAEIDEQEKNAEPDDWWKPDYEADRRIARETIERYEAMISRGYTWRWQADERRNHE